MKIMKEAEDLLLQACAMLYEQDKHKNRARMGHILGYFRQFAPSRILEAQAIINPARFGKYAKNPDSLPAKAMKDAMEAVAIDTHEPEPAPAKKTRGRKAKDQCCG